VTKSGRIGAGAFTCSIIAPGEAPLTLIHGFFETSKTEGRPRNALPGVDANGGVVTDNELLVTWHAELSPDGKKLYVANGLTNDLTVIDVGTQKAEKSVPVGVAVAP
jgi:YVTN family beta-propeller protein